MVICSNPPFSIWGEYYDIIRPYKKLVVGSQLSIVRKNVFPDIRSNTLTFGYERPHYFKYGGSDEIRSKSAKFNNDHWEIPFSSICWFTNIRVVGDAPPLDTGKSYYGNEDKYPKLDGTNIINCDKVKDIPMDYAGDIAVPITWYYHYNKNQFNIVGLTNTSIRDPNIDIALSIVAGQRKFSRIVIRGCGL